MKLINFRILIIFLITLTSRVYSNGDSTAVKEQYKITLYFETDCDSIIRILSDYSLNRNDKSYPSDSGISILPEKGQYTLKSYSFESLEIHKITISTREQIDTINFSRIHIARSPGIPPWPYTSVCGKRANGTYSDYWPNGDPRISGKFKNGQAKEISIYNSSGQIVKRQINKKLHTLYEQYEDNKLIIRYGRILFFKFGKVWSDKEEKYIK